MRYWEDTKNPRWMKFLYWQEDIAWFRKATWWEILKNNIRYFFTNKPDPNNLIIYLAPGIGW